MVSVEAGTTAIHYPPSAIETEPVGQVSVSPHVGGCAIKVVVLKEEIKNKLIDDALPFYGLRVGFGIRRAVTQANFHAERLLSYDSDPFGYNPNT